MLLKNINEPKCANHNQRITIVNQEKSSQERFMCDECIKNKQMNKVILFSKAFGINQEIKRWQIQILEKIQEFQKIFQRIKEEFQKQLNQLDNIIQKWTQYIQNLNEQFNLQFDEFDVVTQKMNQQSVSKIKNILQNLFKLESIDIFIEQLSNFDQKIERQKNEKQNNNIQEINKQNSKIIQILYISNFDWEKESIFNNLIVDIDSFQIENGNKIVQLKTKIAFLKIIQLTPDKLQIRRLIQNQQMDAVIFEIDDILIENYEQLVKLFRNDQNHNKEQIAFLTQNTIKLDQEQLISMKKFAKNNKICLLEFYKNQFQNVREQFNYIASKLIQDIQNDQKQIICNNNSESQQKNNQSCNLGIEQMTLYQDNEINQSNRSTSQKRFDSLKDPSEFDKNLVFKQFYEDCLIQKMDVIQTDNTKYDYLVQFTNLNFYFNSKNLNSPLPILKQKIYQSIGKLYFTEFDENINPKYLIQEGSFEIDIKSLKFILNGQGIEYAQKSNVIKYEGEFYQGQLKQNQIRNDERKHQPQYQNQNSQKELYLQNNDLQYQKHWCKLNQQFNQKDNLIFSQNQWLPSRIIDAYVNYLNLNNEKRYFQTSKEQRHLIKRILFMPTTLSTNYAKPYDFNQAKNKFDSELLQYQEINYDLKKVYSKVGFPINKYNSHWYFLLYDLQSQEVTYVNSLTMNGFEDQLVRILSQLLNSNPDINIIQNQLTQQNDGYSCGYHVCSVMQYYSEIQFNKKVEYHYNETQIKTILQEIIQQV